MSESKNLVEFTTINSTSGPVSKEYTLDEKTIKKTPAASMVSGTAKYTEIEFKDFAAALAEAGSNTAFCYGTHSERFPDKVEIVVSGQEQEKENVISRTKKYLKFRGNKCAVLMIDHDPSEYGKKLKPKEMFALLIKIHPEIAKATMIARGSVSAGVHLVGTDLRNDKGFHFYIPVCNGRDIPVYGKLLFDYLWLNGYGHIALSSNGSMLVRSAIDGCVFSAERLDFVGKPVISGVGLKYTQPKAKYKTGKMLDTTTLPELSKKQTIKLAMLIAKAKEEMKPASEIKAAKWGDDRITKMVAAGVPSEKATEIIKQMLAGGCENLPPDYILDFPSGAVSVADVITDHESYDKQSLADPIEGVGYGRTTAKFWWNEGVPIVSSFAHGQQTTYFLQANKDWKQILEEHVNKFNETHSNVIVGGKNRIMRLEPGSAMHNGRDTYAFYVRNDLVNVHANGSVKTGEKESGGKVVDVMKNPITAWVTDPRSRSYTGGIIFSEVS